MKTTVRSEVKATESRRRREETGNEKSELARMRGQGRRGLTIHHPMTDPQNSSAKATSHSFFVRPLLGIGDEAHRHKPWAIFSCVLRTDRPERGDDVGSEAALFTLRDGCSCRSTGEQRCKICCISVESEFDCTNTRASNHQFLQCPSRPLLIPLPRPGEATPQRERLPLTANDSHSWRTNTTHSQSQPIAARLDAKFDVAGERGHTR